MSEVPVIDLSARPVGRPRRPRAGRPRDRRGVPRDRLLRHHRPRRARPHSWTTCAARPTRSSRCRAAEKLAVAHPVAGTNRGYHPVGGEALSKANDAAAPPDLKEFFHVGPVGRRRRPVLHERARAGSTSCRTSGPRAPAGLRARRRPAYYRAMGQLVVFLMRLAALALDVDETFFDDKVDRSIGTMRLNYYPAQATPPAAGPAPRQRAHRLRRLHDPERRGRAGRTSGP